MSRPLTQGQITAEKRAFDSTMRIFGRYGVDPRKAPKEGIAAAMLRMTTAEVECVATAQRLVMALNGVHGGLRLDG